MDLFDHIKGQVREACPKIVFPEGGDERIIKAVTQLAEDRVITPVLIAKREDANDLVLQLEAEGDLEIRNFDDDREADHLVDQLVKRRKGKTDAEKARQWLNDENYYGTMLVYTGQADGLVSGAAHSTADTVRPALQLIKTKPGVKKTSGAFIMVKGEEKLVFADCAINIDPDSQDLAENAVESAKTAKIFGIDPKVAMLSFSTMGSAQGEQAEKVAGAVKLAREANPNLIVDGEIQFDAAYVPEVAQKKAPDSVLAGGANVFIFPSLEAGNIGYKMVQRLGGYQAVGPILQGLNQPVNDLSRGCSAEDVYNLALITALQSLNK